MASVVWLINSRRPSAFSSAQTADSDTFFFGPPNHRGVDNDTTTEIIYDSTGHFFNPCPACQNPVTMTGPNSFWCPFCGRRTRSSSESTNDYIHHQLPRVNESRPRSISNSLVRLLTSLGRGRSPAEPHHTRRSRSTSRLARMMNSNNAGGSRQGGPHFSGMAHAQPYQSMDDLLPPIDAPPKSAESMQHTFSAEGSRQLTTKFGGAQRMSASKKRSKGAKRDEKDFDVPLKIYKTPNELRQAFDQAKRSDNWADLFVYYTSTFSSFQDLNSAFLDSESGTKCGLNLSMVKCVIDQLNSLPCDVQKAVLKSVINCLLTDQRNFDVILMRSVSKDDLRAYLIMLQYPQFRKPSTYVVYAHLLRQIATLCDEDMRTLSEWFTDLAVEQFSKAIGTVQQFIGVRLFPPKPEELPPVSKCSWWIPCAVKVLAVFNNANDRYAEQNDSPIVPFTEFYNSSLDHWDLLSDFYSWQTPNTNLGFSFCHYPFILSINAKKQLLESHAEQQMIANARDSIIGSLMTQRTPDMNSLFCNITVRRSHLLEDSLREISSKQGQLRKKLRVNFQGEPGLDMGGLTKEWFQLLIRKIFHPDYGMFKYHETSGVYWFGTAQPDIDSVLQEYHLVGVLMGLAVFNGVILDIRFPRCCFKKLLSPPVVPRIIDVQSSALGLIHASCRDMEQIDPIITRGFQSLLDYDGDVEQDFGLNFQVTVEEFGTNRTIDLKSNGSRMPVTNANSTEYVERYVDWYVNRAIDRQFKAFYLGFHSVCSSNLLLLLRPVEIELLVCGSPDFDLSQLKDVTVYDGYKANDKTVRHFWDLVLKLPEKHQKRLLLFVTGSDRVPAGGMKEMVFKITRTPATGKAADMLPMAHTCFNQLVLPDYQDRHKLRKKLAIALAHGEGFGFQ